MGPRPFDSAAANASAAPPADGWIAPDGAPQPRAPSHAMAAAQCGTTAPPVAHSATQPELCELCCGVVAAGEACCEPGCGCGAGAMHRACLSRTPQDMKRLRNAWGAPRRAREPVCFHHKTPNAHRAQLYGSPKAVTRPSRLRSADGAFRGVLRQLYYRFALVWGRLCMETPHSEHTKNR